MAHRKINVTLTLIMGNMPRNCLSMKTAKLKQPPGMRQVTCVSPGKICCHDAPLPSRTGNEVMVKVKRIGICGTDLHAVKGDQPYFTYPRVLGHELSGE